MRTWTGRCAAAWRSCLVAGLVAFVPGAAPAACQDGLAPPFRVDRWTTDDGLPSHFIPALTQGGDGYIWLIASTTLVRFDGVTFRAFPDQDGHRPVSVIGGAGDTVWVVGDWTDGSTFLRRAGGHFEVIARGPPSWRSVVRDSAGRFWVHDLRGLVSLGDGTAPRTVAVEFAMGAHQSWLDGRGRIWIRDVNRDSVGWVGPAGMRYLAGAHGEVLLTDPVSREVLLPYLEGPLFVVRDETGRRLAAWPRQDREPWLVDRSGRIWVAAPGRMELYRGTTAVPLSVIPFPPAKRVWTALVDVEGNVWVGTANEGLYRFSEQAVQVPAAALGMRDPQVRMVAGSVDGSVALLDRLSTLARLRQGRLVTLLALPEDSSAWAIHEDRRGTVWVGGGSPEGAFLIGVRAGRPQLPVDPPEWSQVIVEDPREDGLLWLAGTSIARMRPYRTGTAPEVLYSGIRLHRSLAFDSAGALWFLADRALARIRDGVVEQFPGDGFPARYGRTLHIDADGTIWIGTYGEGLVRYRDGVYRSVRAADGLAEDVVSTILPDAAGNLWMGGNRLIHRVSRRELNAFLDGRIPRVRGVGYGRDAGLENAEGSGYPGALDTAGRLWFPTFGGAVVIDPILALSLEGAPPQVHVEGMNVGGESRAAGPDAVLRLSARERRFDVQYTAISMRDPAAVRFEYRLEGLDEAWVDAGTQRTATFTNVAAGAYTFRVRGVSGSGVAGTGEATLALVVAPFFYETPAFLLVVALILMGLATTVWRVRVRRLLAAQATLSLLVTERTAALEEQTRLAESALTTVAAQAERLRAVDQAKSRFFANVSHEFRTPLTLITGPLRDLSEGRLGALPEAARAEIEVLLQSGRRLNDLVDQLLDIARLESGRLRLAPAVLDAAAFLRRVGDRFRPFARTRSMAFSVDLPDVPVPISMDPDRMEKVVMNLLGNAFKFSADGGHIALRARTTGVAGAGELVITVEDSGIGIPAAMQEHVFDRFFQVDDSSHRQHEGAGIGLALARDLVELHGGRISVTSLPGAGSTFEVRLPLEEGLGLPEEAESAAAAHAAGGADVASPGAPAGAATATDDDVTTVLLVEDNAAVRAYLCRHLSAHYRVLEAANGLEGLAVARRVVPDLIISDLMMPHMDGQALCSAIRADPELSYLPVVLLTARASQESVIAGLQGGADDYLTKPFDVDELLLRVHNQIASRRRLRERLAATERPLPALSVPWPGRTRSAAAFLSRLHEVLAGNIGNEDLDTGTLAVALAMSRSSLYRRVEETTGRPPMDVIWEYRLDQAAQWLTQTQASVSEVAYAVGFKSVPHFSRRFRERFGRTPTEHRRG